MKQAELFTPRLVEVINVSDNSIYESFIAKDYYLAWDSVDDLVDKLGLDDFSFMVSKIEEGKK